MLRIFFIAILSFVFILNASAQNSDGESSYNLNMEVSILVKQQPLDIVLEKLSQQTNCYFTYDAEKIYGDRLITMDLHKVSLKNALDTLLQNPTFSYQLVNNQVVIHPVKLGPQKPNNDSVKVKIAKGVVLSSTDNTGLPFASLIIKNSYYGGITNENGAFDLKIPHNFINDTLVFYFMGYDSFEIPVAKVDSINTILLSPANVSLQEVIIRSVEPKLLLEKARDLFRENYFDKPYNFEAFYRESIKKGNDYRVYSEALINGYKPSFVGGNTNNKIQVLKGRRYKNISKADSLLVKLRGGIQGCFGLDLIHQLPDFLSEVGAELYNYLISDIIVWNGELVYVIDFKQKEYIYEPLFEGQIYLSVNSQAIVGVDFSFSKKMLRKTRNLFIVKKSRQINIRPIATQYMVQYAQWNGKYYTRHVRGELMFKAKKKRQFIRENYATLMEMVYTQVDTSNVKKPVRHDLFKTHTIFSDSEQIYDDAFWNESNIINPENDIIKAFRNSGFQIQNQGIK